MTNHTDISKRLALAIGYRKEDIEWTCDNVIVHRAGGWYRFDYRDEEVAFRIAERYQCFPQYLNTLQTWWVCDINNCEYVDTDGDTPQLAIALAVIEGAGR